MKKVILALMLMASLSFAACNKDTTTPDNSTTSNQSTTTDDANKTDDAEKPEDNAGEKAEIKSIDAAELEKMQLDKKLKEQNLVVDVRSKEEYDAGHLSHAINIGVDDIVADPSILEEYKDKPIILYCNSGKKSGKAAEALVNAGYKDITNAPGVKEFEYTLIDIPAVLGKDLQKVADEGNATIIDARDAKDYEEGHLKGAINANADNVKDMLADIPKDKPVYTYCYSGNKSIEVAKILKAEGYEVYNVNDGTKEFEYMLEK